MNTLINLILGLLMSAMADHPAEVKSETPPETNKTSVEVQKEPAEKTDTYEC
ncbi:hypothetical protein [Salegentibacter chungangensis]|uniref:Uncharacterized protein n=1 Tax=Salegentibacter chungangensis TaxID=1335724 RepID=A0ABW3NTP4_9FLAO